VSELEALQADDAPIDLVGHDWGAGHVYRLVAERPDLVRSWAADVGGLLHPDYQWHDAAKAWQEPEVGEQVIEMMTAMPLEDRVGMYTDFGLSTEMAEPMAAAVTPDMGRAILALYRSAREPQLREFADRLASADHGPGLIITATDDAYVSAEMAGPVAERLGIDELVLDGQGHWWMVHDAERAANGLIRFWNEL
jgi:pimeloyl-ACP methyl ester carboxylesterase